jgi:hypothetical protein
MEYLRSTYEDRFAKGCTERIDKMDGVQERVRDCIAIFSTFASSFG